MNKCQIANGKLVKTHGNTPVLFDLQEEVFD